jgi:hypothetical protein
MATRVSFEIHCKARRHHPSANINTAGKTLCDRPPIPICINLIAGHDLAPDEIAQRIGGVLPALMGFAIHVPTLLLPLNGIDSPQPNSCAVNFNGVAIGDDCLPNVLCAS